MERLSLGRNFRKMQSIRFLMLIATLFLSANRLRADIAMDTSCPASPTVTMTTFFFKAGSTGGGCLAGINGTGVNWNFLTIITTKVALISSYPCVTNLFLGCRVDTGTLPGFVEFEFDSATSGTTGKGIPNGSDFNIDLRTYSAAGTPSSDGSGFWNPGQLFSAAAGDTGFATPLSLSTTDPYLPLNTPVTVPEPSGRGLLILVIGALVIYRRAGGRHRGTT